MIMTAMTMVIIMTSKYDNGHDEYHNDHRDHHEFYYTNMITMTQTIVLKAISPEKNRLSKKKSFFFSQNYLFFTFLSGLFLSLTHENYHAHGHARAHTH